MKRSNRCLIIILVFTTVVYLVGDKKLYAAITSQLQEWYKIDNFELDNALQNWTLADTRNDTEPHVENPQVTEIHKEGEGNHFLIKKPAADDVIGNRKALSSRKLPVTIEVGDTYTIYTRINVEYFPNNHSFGLSNLDDEGIAKNDYNAFEPSLRITDKNESDGLKNDGTLMVKTGDGYQKIYNFSENRDARPLQTDTWYELWYVVNNDSICLGGQKYDVYIRGGDEFPAQMMVSRGAVFRMKREKPLIYFMAICNTGPTDNPYGNGGVRYDDLYMAKGVVLTNPF